MLRSSLGLGVACLFIALIAAFFGFETFSAEPSFVAKFFFFIFLILAATCFMVGGIYYRCRTSWVR